MVFLFLGAYPACSVDPGYSRDGTLAVQNRREWPFMALSIANVDCSEFDAEIATTASRRKRNRLTRRQIVLAFTSPFGRPQSQQGE